MEHVYHCDWCGEDKDPNLPTGHEGCIEALGYDFDERPRMYLVVPEAS